MFKLVVCLNIMCGTAEPGGAVADAGLAAAGGAARAAAPVAHLHQGARLVGLRGKHHITTIFSYCITHMCSFNFFDCFVMSLHSSRH